MSLRRYRCGRCASTWAPDATRWRCDCGGWLELADDGGSGPTPVSLGAGGTPEVDVVVAGRRLRAKVEYANPTGSFKDRGAEVLVGLAVAVGATQLVADSSGNAGIAIAAHAEAAGLPIEVFVANPGETREEVAAAAIARVEATGAFYASHVYNPWFWEGTAGVVLELDPLPDTLLLPVGNGTLVLGAFAALRRLGAVDRCRIVAVQAASCAPIAHAFDAGLDDAPAVAGQPTVAKGIAIAAPARGVEVLRVVRATGGRVVTVTDDEIGVALGELAAQRHAVEPTAAAAVAGARWLTDDDGDVVVPLSGANP